VTADGEVIRTASHARKSSAGYNLTQLFCGSEGTLGLITEATVRIHPHPEVVAAAVVHFPTVRAAVDGVIESIQLGVPLARAEMLDSLTIKAVNAHSYTTLAEKPTCSWSSRAARRRSKNRPPWCARSRAATAAASSNGPACRRSARACGRRGTTPTSPRCNSSPAAEA